MQDILIIHGLIALRMNVYGDVTYASVYFLRRSLHRCVDRARQRSPIAYAGR